ncbi:ATP-dependent Clp protease proteolytic subunit [Pseudomonas sp. GX19020]|uniref:head maturation protease, ClpP-related n=1 Tax=Pseudomonas sp. GX19020 TaxID=2942277 RepID=UPI0020194EBD|nr:head maturation protease, ClpP-related [Pseudomonas sp. GX19020]MCL4069007.1 ATP-dependent Clp protease proteolytic subunit [Pseudomonas sp. GX19020]
MNEIFLTGTVGQSFWDEECFTIKSVREALMGLSGPLTVHLNSGGGIAHEGQAIHNALKNYDGEVTIIIDGIAASAASLIAMAGDRIVMPLGAIMMIHDPARCFVEGRGTEEDHLQEAKALGVIATAYAAVYAARAGISVEDARAIMKAETYYDGAAAVEAGFATEADDATEAVAAALFDYRLYPKASAGLRAIGGMLKKKPKREAVLAALSGERASKSNPKGTIMPGKTRMEDQDDETTADLDEDLTSEEEEETTSTEDDETTGSEDDDDTTAEGGEGSEEDEDNPNASAIFRFAASRKVGADIAMSWVKRGLTVAQATKEFKAKYGDTTMTKPRQGLSRARILRDERDTRRKMISEAISGQITRAPQVSAGARQFMDMSLVEIAAMSIGYNGRIRNTGDKMQVFMDASHSTSDFPAIFQNALNKVLLDRYSDYEPTYRLISKKKNFRDFRPMPLIRAGDFPTLLPVGETGEIKWGTFGEGSEVALLGSYARGLTISRQMLVNDELGAIDEVLSSYGESIVHFEERTFYKFALRAELSDGAPIFDATHGNLAAAGAAINTTSLSAGRAAMRKQKSIDKQTLNLSPSILLVGPDQETAAEMILAQITPTAADAVNPFSGRMKPVVASEITGKEWYLLSERAPCWVHGFLEGAEAPRVRTEEPFGTQGFSMTVEHDFGLGAADFRGGYKNPGE